jgi:hypothetical protein
LPSSDQLLDEYAIKKLPDEIDYVLHKKCDTDVFVLSDDGDSKDNAEDFTDPFFEAELASFG